MITSSRSTAEIKHAIWIQYSNIRKRSKGTLINGVCVKYKCLYIVSIKTESDAIQIKIILTQLDQL